MKETDGYPVVLVTTRCGHTGCSASKNDLHLIYGKSLELLALRLDEDSGGGDDSFDSLVPILLNRACSNTVHVFTRPPCIVN